MIQSLFSPKRMRLYALLSLLSQVLLVVTGGFVRLTGSGLGCPTWPNCTDESLVTVPAMGIHGIIEFTNRMLTFALLVIALLTIVVAWKLRKSTGVKVFGLSLVLLAGIPAQAVLGGFTVLTKLDPWFVGAHFVLSGILIAVASVLYIRTLIGASTRHYTWISLTILLVGWVAVLVGIVVTGAGPHAGDAHSPRNGLNLDLWQHIHSWPAYLTLVLVVYQTLRLRSAVKTGSQLQLRVSYLLLGALVVQAAIGVLQARLGVPIGLVAIHMLGASTLISLLQINFSLSRR